MWPALRHSWIDDGKVGSKRLEAQGACHHQCVGERFSLRDRQRSSAGRVRAMVEQGQALARCQLHTVVEVGGEVGVRPEVTHSGGSQRPDRRQAVTVQGVDQRAEQLGPNPGVATGQVVEEPEHHGPDDVARGSRPLRDSVTANQAGIELGDLGGWDSHALEGREPGGGAIDDLVAIHHLLEDPPRSLHPGSHLRVECDPGTVPRHLDYLINRQARAGHHDRHRGVGAATPPQTAAAVRAMVSSLERSSSTLMLLPTTEVLNPHCGLSASRSSGMYWAASRIRASSSGTVSRRGVLVVTRPSTTILSSGTWRSGSNDPDRSSSYSSRSRWTRVPRNTWRAIGS